MKEIKVKNTLDLGVLFANNDYDVAGMDGGYSIPLNNNTLWFFGDTLIGERTKGESLWYPGGQRIGPGNMAGTGKIRKMLTNSALLVPGNKELACWANYGFVTDDRNKLRQLIRYLPEEDRDEYRIWCLHGIQLEKGIYLYYQKVQMLGEGDVLPVNFRIVGSGLAFSENLNENFNRLTFEGQTILWNESQPQFASSVLNNTETDGYIYCYGVLQNKQAVQQCYIARVKPDIIGQKSKYEYLAGKDNIWDSKIENAIKIFESMPNELSVSYNKYLNAYLSVHSLDLTGKIVARTAPDPWGPWSDYTKLYQVKAERKIKLPYPVLIYAGKEHPELAEKDGQILHITYVEFEEYYPHLVRIELN